MSTTEQVVVVGATGAFGTMVVDKLLSEGLSVIAVARSSEALATMVRSRPGLIPCIADIGDDSSIDAIRAAVTGPVRMVVHGPGLPFAGGVLSASPSVLAEAVNIKAGGMLRLVRAVDDHLLPHSRLVAIGGHYGLEPSAYAAAPGVGNAALVNLVRQLSLAYGERGVTAHLLVPGPADTERLRRVAADRAALRGIDAESVLDEMRAESSIKAFLTPEQVAWAVSLLLAPEADAMTGSALMLDAGRRRGLP